MAKPKVIMQLYPVLPAKDEAERKALRPLGPGSDYPVFNTEHGIVGLAMCSEVYMPEVARALALRGAEIIFMPAGTDKRRLWETWRTLLFARAIENLAVVVSTQNLLTSKDRGLAFVATPEEVVLESTKAGMMVVDVDLDRTRELRNGRDEVGSSKSCATKQGLLSEQWQRPELYDTFMPRRQLKAAE